MLAPTDAAALVGDARDALLRGELPRARLSAMSAREAGAAAPAVFTLLADIAAVEGRFAVAAALGERAVAEDPSDGRAWLALANVLWRGQRLNEASDALSQAEARLGQTRAVLHNRGLLSYYDRAPAEATRLLARALDIEPLHPWLRNDYAHAVLKTGDLKRGLELYEARWETLGKSSAWGCGKPLWGGEPCGGTLLLHAEQGFGDTLQFIRFVPEVRGRGCFDRVVFAGPAPLKHLIIGQCGVDAYVDFADVSYMVQASTAAKVHCPLVSAVARLGHTYEDLPAPAPYLEPPYEDDGVRERLHPPGTTAAVGLVWSASAGPERSRQRSVPLLNLLTIGSVPGVKLWSLQTAPFAMEAIETGADLMISDAMGGVSDFADTAMIMCGLDAVVSVDTAAVHLAGALGVRCLMLNPYNHCWRWARGAAPWYGGAVELFDQDRDLSWSRALSGVKSELTRLVASLDGTSPS